MNIRSLSNSAPIIQPTKVPEVNNAIKPHDTAERDADGRQPFGENKRPVTDEELEKIMKDLKAHPGVVKNNLIVELLAENDAKVILIKTQEGQIIRRVPEDQFYQLLDSMDQTNGRLFNKAA